MEVLGYCLVLAGVAALYLDVGPQHWCEATSGAGWSLLALDSFQSGHVPSAVLSAGLAAVDLYRWWNGGGGDGTRRRLRALAGRFQGVRRTAPTPT